MGVVIGYLIGILVLFGICALCISSIKSFIEWIRDRSKKKKSPENESADTRGDVDEDARKGGGQN